MLCGCIDIGTNTTRVLVAEARDGRLREVLQRRAFTRLGRGLAPGGAIPARADRRDRARRRRAARAGRAAGRADDPRGRHGGDPARRQPRRVRRGDARRTAASTSACSTARRRRGWRSWAPRARSAAPLPGRVGGGRRRRRLDRDRGRHARRRRRRGATSFPFGSGLLADALPARRPADRRRAARRCATHARGVLETIDVRRPVGTAVAVGRQRRLAAAAGRRARSTARRLERALGVLARRTGRRRRRPLRPRRAARAADARPGCWCSTRPPRRSAGRCRSAAAGCARASCSTWPARNNSFTLPR